MKKNVFFVILAVFMALQVQAIELWNGFTTEMGRNEVRARAREVLAPTDEYIVTDSSFNVYFTVFIYDKENLNSQFPKTEAYIDYHSSLEGIDQSYKWNVSFYFYKDNLFSVQIRWKATGPDLLTLARKEYGNNYETTEATRTVGGSRFVMRYYTFKASGKIIFIDYLLQGNSDNRGRMSFVDGRSANFAAEQAKEEARIEQERKAAEEAKRNADLNAVKF